MTQDLSLKSSNTEMTAASDGATVSSVSIADPYVLLRMTDGSIQLLVGDPSTCSVPNHGFVRQVLMLPGFLLGLVRLLMWLMVQHMNGDVYCVLCYDNGDLEIFDVPNFNIGLSQKIFLDGLDLVSRNCFSDISVIVPEAKNILLRHFYQQAEEKMSAKRALSDNPMPERASKLPRASASDNV
ncbi:hypothetical protein SASPL_115171 [Salvia splendens]|uniref:RSE1/DDB1/CPSF1 second beta-propeller domain-containing protein n=1 Tax=Salvia splendens TaxID=180675 RepID=A0A8X9A1V8_SALSN|nr:hypothetical protein SASPL_115171 [Salvia splendens]